MKEVEISDIYQMLKESVRFSSHTNNDLRPNTFAVVESEQAFLSDVSNEQLGYTILAKNKPHFFSRIWEATGYNPSAFSWAYPGVFVFEQSMTHENIFNNQASKHWQISINVLVQDYDTIKTDTFESALPYKTVSELYVDAENILLNLFKYFDRCCIASTTLDSTKKLYNRDYLAYMQSMDNAFNYTIDESKSRIFFAELTKHNNQPKVFNRGYIDALNSVLVYVEMVIPSNCQDFGTFEFYSNDPYLTQDQTPDPYLVNTILVDSNDDPIVNDNDDPIPL
jgi:hypothetical protein